MLALFAIAFATLLSIYVVVTVPGGWFPRSEAKNLSLRDVTMSKGTGQPLREPHTGDALAVMGTDDAGLAVVSAVTDFRSTDYPIVAWQGYAFADDADVNMLWRNDYAPGKVNSRKLVISGGRIVPATMSKDPNWIGRVTGVALAIRGPFAEPPRIAGLSLRPGGVVDALREIVGGWFSFERWSGASINTRSGGADVQELPLSLLLALSLALAAIGWYAWARSRGRAAAWPVAVAASFVVAWMVLDVQWVANLTRQVAETREQFGGKDWQARHEAADDGEVFKFIERVRGKLPAAPARVFMLADAAPLRGRGAYYLYPHNVLFDPFGNALPPAASLRAGDYIVVYHRRGVQYNREARRLRFEGGDSVQADIVMVEPGAAVFKVS